MKKWAKINQKRKNSEIEGRKTIPDWKRLAKSIYFRIGEANGNSEYSNITQNISERQYIYLLKTKFPNLFNQQGKIKGHKIKGEYKKGATITKQKGRRFPLQLQEAVEAEIDKLLNEGHKRRVETVSDEVFIQPVVVTVKKDKTVKIALDPRSMNNAILKEKYQMPKLDNLMEQVAEITNSDNTGEVLFTFLDKLYAYGQTDLHPDTARHCGFQIIRGRATGTYAFNTGYHGLTIMHQSSKR